MPTKLKISICLFSENEEIIYSVKEKLNSNAYKITVINKKELFIDSIKKQQEKIDCLLICERLDNHDLWLQIEKLDILLPLVIVYQNKCRSEKQTVLYHPAEIKLDFAKSEQLSTKINLAIAQFLNLIPPSFFEKKTKAINDSLIEQQHRIGKKLKEKLGYVETYYKRNPQDFYQNMVESEQKKLHKKLKKEYRNLILIYFENEPNTNKIIDSFVNLAFFSDISISIILEIHMELMEEFSQQIKLEGRHEDILLDYRLALIDIMSHLCEMYRRSVPKEYISFKMLFDRGVN